MLGRRGQPDVDTTDAFDVSFEAPVASSQAESSERKISLPDIVHAHADHVSFSSSADNIKNAVDYVNHELASYGYPSPLVFVGAKEQQASDVINTVFALLQQRQKDASYRDDMNVRYRRLQSDYENMTVNTGRLKQSLETSERNNKSIQGKLRQAEVNLKGIVEKQRFMLDELKLTKSSLIQTKSQCQHELRRRDHESSKFKEKMAKLANDRMRESKIQFQVANPVIVVSSLRGTTGNSRSTTVNTSREDEFMQTVLQSLEERQHDVLAENETLRTSLFELWSELEHMKAAVDQYHHDTANEDNAVAIIPATFQLPYELVRDNIEERVRISLQQIRDMWQLGRHMDALPEETTRKDNMIEEQKTKISKQDTIITQLAEKLETLNVDMDKHNELLETWFTAANAMQFASDSDTSYAIDSPARDIRVRHTQQRAQELERERTEFTDAALRLGRERTKLDRERALFEAAKLAADIREQHHQEQDSVEALLKMLPPTPQQQKTTISTTEYLSTASEFKQPIRKPLSAFPSTAPLSQSASIKFKPSITVNKINQHTQNEADSDVFSTTEDHGKLKSDNAGQHNLRQAEQQHSFFSNLSRIPGCYSSNKVNNNNNSGESTDDFVVESHTLATPMPAFLSARMSVDNRQSSAGVSFLSDTTIKRPSVTQTKDTNTYSTTDLKKGMFTSTPSFATANENEATAARLGKEKEDAELASYFATPKQERPNPVVIPTNSTQIKQPLLAHNENKTHNRFVSPTSTTLGSAPSIENTPGTSLFHSEHQTPVRASSSQHSTLATSSLLKSALKNSSKMKTFGNKENAAPPSSGFTHGMTKDVHITEKEQKPVTSMMR